MIEFPLYNTTLKNPVRKIRESFNLSLSLKVDFGEQSVSLYPARRTQPARNHDRGEESIQTSDELARNTARAVLFHISSFEIVATKNFRTFRSKEKSSFLPDFKLATVHYYGIGRIELEMFIHLANTSC